MLNADNARQNAVQADEEARAAAAMAATRAICGTLLVAEALIATGQRIDLTGLENRVGAICARVLDLSPPHGAAVIPALREIYCALLRAERTFRAQQRDAEPAGDDAMPSLIS